PEDGAGAPEEPSSFNLQHLMREVHDAAVPAAENRGIGLAWYMPPHLGSLYRGAASALRETLAQLVDSSIRATRHGAVHFSVRRVPESMDRGHLLFTITDTGVGTPPNDRSSLALSHAWELAARHNGYLGVESSPRGATVAFTLHLAAMELDDAPPAEPRTPLVIVASENDEDRRLLCRMLRGLPCRIEEAETLSRAQRINDDDAATLLIVQGRLATPMAAPVTRRFHEQAKAAGLPPCKVLAITRSDSQWGALADAGFTLAMLEPVDEGALRETVEDVLAAYGRGVEEAAARRAVRTSPDLDDELRRKRLGKPAQTHKEQTENKDRSPLPDLFGPPDDDRTSPMRMPDLTALPDLMELAQSLGAGKKASAAPVPDLFAGVEGQSLSADAQKPAAAAVPEAATAMPMAETQQEGREDESAAAMTADDARHAAPSVENACEEPSGKNAAALTPPEAAPTPATEKSDAEECGATHDSPVKIPSDAGMPPEGDDRNKSVTPQEGGDPSQDASRQSPPSEQAEPVEKDESEDFAFPSGPEWNGEDAEQKQAEDPVAETPPAFADATASDAPSTAGTADPAEAVADAAAHDSLAEAGITEPRENAGAPDSISRDDALDEGPAADAAPVTQPAPPPVPQDAPAADPRTGGGGFDGGRRPPMPATSADAPQAPRASLNEPLSPYVDSPFEWVGEPMPVTQKAKQDTLVQKTAPVAHRPAVSGERPSPHTGESAYVSPHAPLYVEEWVGEPTPIERKAAPARQAEERYAVTPAPEMESPKIRTPMPQNAPAVPPAPIADAQEKPAPRAAASLLDFIADMSPSPAEAGPAEAQKTDNPQSGDPDVPAYPKPVSASDIHDEPDAETKALAGRQKLAPPPSMRLRPRGRPERQAPDPAHLYGPDRN
ncbi:MAG: hypothetical protein J5838_05865, partial [Desulfovibrio sp.]|nr:hypothetical protein [Desulfovibrio sp.]